MADTVNVNPTPDRDPGAAALAEHELKQLNVQVDQTRELLGRLRREISVAESQLSESAASQLLEANEQLVLRMLQAQSDAENAALRLDQVSRSAELDGLTELPNRALILDRLTHAIAHARRHRGRLAVLFLDLDDFKQINDTLGHAVGDEVLKCAAACLSASVRQADTVSRYGGDEFLILLADVTRPSDAARVAQKVAAALAAPCHAGDHELKLSGSIGISIYPDDGDDAETLIAHADIAMYEAKRQGLGSFAFYGKPPSGVADSNPPVLDHRAANHALALAQHERRHEQLREANEQLVLAALTAQELQNSAEQEHRRQTEFLAVLAHELRNPLAPIRTAAALLGRVRNDEELMNQLQGVIERQVAHMSRLVGDLLDVSRVNTGKLRLERRMVDIAAVIGAAVETCRPAMETRQQRFVIALPSCALEVHGDPVRLAQVISNLLDNASKYTPDGGEIKLTLDVVETNIVLSIADTGIGITPGALPKIFEPFVQDDHAIGFNGVGLGIGLTVVRELVEAHGGSVVASSPGTGRGSRFVVTLPLLTPLPGV